jgi:hypothetical protein
MKISIIHNTYRYNPFIRESVILNVKALKEAGIDYQYIVFNDNGDKEIETLVKDLDIEYHYSDFNYGFKMCSGGWVGAIKLLSGDLVHNIGQDDVFTSLFYKKIYEKFEKTNCDLVYCNGFMTNENLTMTGNLLGPLNGNWDYKNPREVFNNWLGVENKKITKANNYIPAPGTVYKAKLHNQIGPPDLDNFRAVADFEYWVRILYYEKYIEYIQLPLWLYRISKYSVGKEVIDGKVNDRDLVPYYHEKLKEKYQNLLDNE